MLRVMTSLADIVVWLVKYNVTVSSVLFLVTVKAHGSQRYTPLTDAFTEMLEEVGVEGSRDEPQWNVMFG